MTKSFPLLPLRDIVVFPQMIVPLFVGRDKSVVALEKAMEADKDIFLVAQLDPAEDDPDRDALYDLGVIATVLQLLKLPDGTRSEEHTSEIQSLMRISYAVFCLKKKKKNK